MTTNLKDDVARLDQSMSSNGTPTSPTIVDQNENNARTLQVSFSHIQLYTDRIGSIEEYKQLEDSLNEFDKCASLTEISEQRKAWKLLESGSLTEQDFVSQNRDVVKQLLVGFGFRVTGHRFPNKREMTNTRSLLVTSRDPNGVQIVVTAIDASEDQPADSYFHFDAGTMERWLHFQQLYFFLQSHYKLDCMGREYPPILRTPCRPPGYSSPRIRCE